MNELVGCLNWQIDTYKRSNQSVNGVIHPPMLSQYFWMILVSRIVEDFTSS